MITRIVGFGDSWIHGDGVSDTSPDKKSRQLYREQNCLIGQLAQCLEIPYDSDTVKNFGTSGGSLQSTLWDFALWNQQNPTYENTLVVVGLTESWRESWWHCDQITDNSLQPNYIHNHNGHGNQGPGWEQFKKFHLINANCTQQWRMKYYLTTEYFGNWAKANSVNLLMFNVFPAPIESPHVIESNWNARGELARLEHTVGDVTAPCKHPNEKGYHLLAKHLHKMLQSNIIT